VPLEERTAIANARTRGVETDFLNFASNHAAKAVAARENAGSLRTMRELPGIVKAIALNNKIHESRELAAAVQTSMFDRLRRVDKQARYLGVKQAPFMVLIGATMPSVLAEISVLTNRSELGASAGRPSGHGFS
jgi:N-acetylmuramoyl-L-alanine amidase